MTRPRRWLGHTRPQTGVVPGPGCRRDWVARLARGGRRGSRRWLRRAPAGRLGFHRARAHGDAAPPTPAVSPVATVAMKRSVPTRLRIPAIGVDSSLMSLGLKSDGSLETPPGAFPAGWFTGGPTPGQIGPAIIVGHVRYNTPGVFARLTRAAPRGRRSSSGAATARRRRFRVTKLAAFREVRVPDEAGLRQHRPSRASTDHVRWPRRRHERVRGERRGLRRSRAALNG